MSAGRARTAPAQRLPLFGVEIELYVKVKPRIEVLTREKKRTNLKSLPEHWQKWDFDLKNDPPTRPGQIEVVMHRMNALCPAVQAEIDTMLGKDSGWECKADPSMSERKIALPPDARKWWGVEIVSPPMSVSKQWQQEIDMVYRAVNKTFDIYTTDYCGCHVHVSPGPTRFKADGYKLSELVRMAKASFFWEAALSQYLPPDRRETEFAAPNHKFFATEQYEQVPQKGWGPVFNKIESLAVGEDGEAKFLVGIQGGKNDGERYISFNFAAFKGIGTVEFRRQAGVLSPITTTHRILFALGLHLSAMRYDFNGAKARTTYPTAEELRKELAGCIKSLPETCHGTRFLNFLTWCYESYQGGKRFTEAQINIREQALRKGVDPPAQQSAILPPPPKFVPGEGRPLPDPSTYEDEEYSSTDVSSDEEIPTPQASTGGTRAARGSRPARRGARASSPQGGQGRGGARGRTPAQGTAPRPTTTVGTARGGNTATQGTAGRGSTSTGAGRGGATQGTSTGRGGAAQNTSRGGAAQGTGRGGAAQNTGRGGAAQGTGTPGRAPAPTPTSQGTGRAPANPQGGAGGAGPRSPTARTAAGNRAPANPQGGAGGAGPRSPTARTAAGNRAPAAGTQGTTRLPERPAASGNTGNTARNTTAGNTTGGGAAGTTRPARRRQEGENA